MHIFRNASAVRPYIATYFTNVYDALHVTFGIEYILDLFRGINVWLPRTSYSWWRHQIETFSALLALSLWGESPVNSGFPSQRPVTRNFEVFFDLSEQTVEQTFRMPVIRDALLYIKTSL